MPLTTAEPHHKARQLDNTSGATAQCAPHHDGQHQPDTAGGPQLALYPLRHANQDQAFTSASLPAEHVQPPTPLPHTPPTSDTHKRLLTHDSNRRHTRHAANISQLLAHTRNRPTRSSR
jgi:hypothetical protein